MPTRPKLPKTDPEMQRWCALLAEEVSGWPRVTTRPMFGMLGLCRDGRMFAALPDTRAAETPFSMLLKLPGVEDDRLGVASGPGAGWVTFEMQSEADTTEALRWLERAYRNAPRAGQPKAGARRGRAK